LFALDGNSDGEAKIQFCEVGVAFRTSTSLIQASISFEMNFFFFFEFLILEISAKELPERE
jgi:hypothetical protein